MKHFKWYAAKPKTYGFLQRLEFLGDAVLDYLITSYLFSVYPKLKPGQLTDLRSVLVNNRAFARVAVNRSLHTFLKCDSDKLSEAINNYVDHTKKPSSETVPFEGPKCPKVGSAKFSSILYLPFLIPHLSTKPSDVLNAS